MPQATRELREEWDGPSDEKALAYLKAAGYRLTRCWTWVPPAGHTPTAKERSAAEFLIQEWDFGGIEMPKQIGGEKMRLLFSNDWLRKRIASDPDFGPEAGDPFGERGRPFEVSYFSDKYERRLVYGHTATAEEARGMADAIERQGAQFVQVTDLRTRPALYGPATAALARSVKQ